MLKEQVAKLDYMWRFCGIPDEYEAEWEKEGELVKQNCRAFAQELLSLFKAKVDKLTVIDDRVIPAPIYGDKIDITANLKAQLRHNKKQLLDLMGE